MNINENLTETDLLHADEGYTGDRAGRLLSPAECKALDAWSIAHGISIEPPF